MNNELYTSEFRHIKYLKSSPSAVRYYKQSFRDINNIQPWADQNDPNFVWPHRIEFLEQLLDLKDEYIYLVDVEDILSSRKRYSETRIVEIKHPIIYQGHLLRPQDGRRIMVEDIPSIEERTYNFSSDPNYDYHLCSGDYFHKKDTILANYPEIIIKLFDLPIIPHSGDTYSAMFYNKEWAEKYKSDVTEFIGKYHGTISTIASKL